jgi:two-component system chemotaxis sensor kinase CheA
MTMSEDLELVQAFVEEATELMESFEQGLLELEKSPDDPEVLNRIFRAAHTIKGNSGMLGFTDIAHFTHTLEEVLDRMRKGRLRVTRDGMTLLLRALDLLKLQFAALTQPGSKAPDGAQLIQELSAYAGANHPPNAEGREGGAGERGRGETEETREPRTSHLAPRTETAETETEDRPPRLGEILVAEKAVTPDQLSHALSKQKRIGEILIEEKVVAPEQVVRALEKQALAAPRGDAATLRVQTEKVDKLINLVGEMVIAQSILTQVVSRFSLDQLPRLKDAVGELDRNSRELQERVMAVRMVPIKTVFSRIPRLVRDLAGQFGKQVALEINGEETELDKTVVERIGDPLTHLVRNALDHGIEPPDVRQALGKPEQGTVRLGACHESGNIVIRLTDDGAGLNRDRILRKAIQQGLVQEHEKLTDEQVYQLIFAAGLSTAEKITDVSGRGVGMDVVRKNIEALGGSATIQSQPGQGCTFTIRLPLTLAILDGLSVQVGEEIYIIPLVNITESLRPKTSQLQTVVGRGEMVDVRGHALPILRLYQILGVTPRVTDPTESLLVIVENGGERIALLVDELLDQHQVVIKSLETNYRKVPGASGATIMGDGRVALILDIPGLVRMSAERHALRPAA